MNRVDEPNGQALVDWLLQLISSLERKMPVAAQHLQNSTTPAGVIPVVANQVVESGSSR